MSIKDPSPTKRMRQACSHNAERIVSDEEFRQELLSDIAKELHYPGLLNFDDIYIATPPPINFKVAILKIGIGSRHQIKNAIQGDEIEVMGEAICFPVDESFCPIILIHSDTESTINHESIHLNQQLKASYYPFDKELTAIDRQSLIPSNAVNSINKTFGFDRALDYAIKKPCAILREEAEAWWRIDFKEGIGSAEYFAANSMNSISKFVCATMEDLKISPEDNKIKESIVLMVQNIKSLGFKDRYCEKIIKSLNKTLHAKYDFSQMVSAGISTVAGIEMEWDLEIMVKKIVDSFQDQVE